MPSVYRIGLIGLIGLIGGSGASRVLRRACIFVLVLALVSLAAACGDASLTRGDAPSDSPPTGDAKLPSDAGRDQVLVLPDATTSPTDGADLMADLAASDVASQDVGPDTALPDTTPPADTSPAQDTAVADTATPDVATGTPRPPRANLSNPGTGAIWRYGGGRGYPDFVDPAWVDTTVVRTLAQFESALASAPPGHIVYVADDATINITGEALRVPEGVWLASGRGRASSPGALLSWSGTSPWRTLSVASAALADLAVDDFDGDGVDEVFMTGCL